MTQLVLAALVLLMWLVAVALVMHAVCTLAPGDLGFDPLPAAADDDDDADATQCRRPCREWRAVQHPDGRPAIAMCRA